MQNYAFTVTTAQAGMRLDQALAEQVEDLSRSRAASLAKDGHVLVDGHPAKAAATLREGQQVTAEVPPRPAPSLEPQALDLDIVFEDEHVLVVNKAAGMVVHPAAGNLDGTLVNALLYHAPELGAAAGDDRPGIVHRLDKGTSGLMVVAKTAAAMRHLQQQFAGRTVKKIYLAIVIGTPHPAKGEIDFPIGRHVSDRKRMSGVTAKGRKATTRYRTLAATRGVSAVECTLLTGRTHQIRVHLAESGWPLVGDEAYGGLRPLARLADTTLRAACQMLGRPALHARQLGFEHPATGAYVEFAAEPPPNMKTILELLEHADG
jgi:23S rRNA pseudouridine1911/1915/1917 synthase